MLYKPKSLVRIKTQALWAYTMNNVLYIYRHQEYNLVKFMSDLNAYCPFYIDQYWSYLRYDISEISEIITQRNQRGESLRQAAGRPRGQDMQWALIQKKLGHHQQKLIVFPSVKNLAICKYTLIYKEQWEWLSCVGRGKRACMTMEINFR